MQDASRDRRFYDNPLVTAPGGIRFYAGAPILAPGGACVGALCVLDSKPRRFTAAQLDKLRLLASALSGTLKLHGVLPDLHDLTLSDPLTGLRNRAGFDEAFLAVLGGFADAGPGLLQDDQ